jgi:hypothetical protein
MGRKDLGVVVAYINATAIGRQGVPTSRQERG